MSYIEIEKISHRIVSWILYLYNNRERLVIGMAPDLQEKAIVTECVPYDRPLITPKYPEIVSIHRRYYKVPRYENPEYVIVSLTLLHNPALLRRIHGMVVRSNTVVLDEASWYTYLMWGITKGGAQHADDST